MQTPAPRPTLSFGVPYYSNPVLLERTLRSLVAQSHRDWQAFVVDDNPEDTGAEQVVRALGDARVRYLKNATNLGIGGNWNRCLDLADTELVTLVHADDELLPHYAETMLAAAERHPEAAAISCEARIIGLEGQKVFSAADLYKRVLTAGARRRPEGTVLQGEEAVTRLLKGNFLMCPTLCYRRSRLGARRFSRTWRFVLDWDFTLRLLMEGEQLVSLPQVAYAYRRHGESTTSKYTSNLYRFEEELAFYGEMQRRAREAGWTRAERQAAAVSATRLNLAYTLALDLLRLDWRSARPKLQLLGRMGRARVP